ncbi:response regulator [Rhizobium sp. WSM1325]|uniref:response regulator n=1 Tax=Rhizobium sp. WSM1325 TaxID=3444086 RepID=UPI0013E2FDC1|nr:response regulator [Rhizobium leguminosarum]
MTLSTPPLEGTVVVVQDEPGVARRLELALSQAGAAVFTTRTSQETASLMRRLQPRIVVMDSGVDPVGAVAIWAEARPDWPCSVIHYVGEGVEPVLGRKVPRTEPASTVVETVGEIVLNE